jgi:type VI secretion system protein VasD
MIRSMGASAIRLGLLSVAAALAAACAKAPVVKPPPPPVMVDVVLNAGAGVNPDAEGRASPLVLRVYELGDGSAFATADFFALWDHEAQVLAAGAGKRHEFVLTPGATATASLKLDATVQQIGVAAAFRDIRNASWRVLVPVSQDPAGPRTYMLSVRADGKSVTAQIENRKEAPGAVK